MTDKTNRQSIIMDIIAAEPVLTQEELKELLCARGVKATQATVSRDIREMNLTKSLDDEGRYRYVAKRPLERDEGRLVGIFRQSVVSIDDAQNLVIIKTLPGAANAACEAVDNMHIPQIVGSLAGDNTCLVITKTVDDARSVKKKLTKLLER